jgi:hypothetical protein
MDWLWSDVQGGLNKFIDDNKKLDGDVKFTLVVFDHNDGKVQLEKVVEVADIRTLAVIDLNKYRPRGTTPLNDAMGITIKNLGSRLAALPESERPNKVLFVTYTDGMENVSSKFSRDKIKEMVTHQETKYNWEFVYLGTNQDVHAVADSLGIAKGNRVYYAHNALGIAESAVKLSAGSLKFRGTNYTKGTYFEEDEK